MEDKTLKNSVGLHYILHQKNRDLLQKGLNEKKKNEIENDSKLEKKPGRPKKYYYEIPRSQEKDISLNTAAYSKARKRLSLELTQKLFELSRINESKNSYSHWHGYRVFIGDGTYVQMQDTPELRKDYEVLHNGEKIDGYPQGLLEAITERGTGQIFSFMLSNRHQSELALFYDMIDDLPENSILLLDDLYNCYEIIAKCERRNVRIVVPAKRKRNYKTIDIIDNGDEIIKIKAPRKRAQWLKEYKEPLPDHILIRKIDCISPEGKEYTLYTTVLDKEIKKEEIQIFYLTRWDIEISIREVKTIMDINILRSKTPEMVLKELLVSLATYNMIRRIIYASIKGLPFSPEKDFIYKFYTLNKNIYIDKKGRVYNRWSTGRKRAERTNKERDVAES
jgi:hypothetical protein